MKWQRPSMLGFEQLEDRRLLAGGLFGGLSQALAPISQVPDQMIPSVVNTAQQTVAQTAGPVLATVNSVPDLVSSVPVVGDTVSGLATNALDAVTSALPEHSLHLSVAANLANLIGLEVTVVITTSSGLNIGLGTLLQTGLGTQLNLNGDVNTNLQSGNPLLSLNSDGGASSPILNLGVILAIVSSPSLDPVVIDVGVDAGTPSVPVAPGAGVGVGAGVGTVTTPPTVTVTFTSGPRNNGTDGLAPQVPGLESPGIPSFQTPELLLGSPVVVGLTPIGPAFEAAGRVEGIDLTGATGASGLGDEDVLRAETIGRSLTDLPVNSILALLHTEGTGAIALEPLANGPAGAAGAEELEGAKGTDSNEAIVAEGLALELSAVGDDLLVESSGLDLAALQDEVQKFLGLLANMRQDVLNGASIYAWMLGLAAAGMVANEFRRRRARRVEAMNQVLGGDDTALPWFMALRSAQGT